jgi:hypothetical protein
MSDRKRGHGKCGWRPHWIRLNWEICDISLPLPLPSSQTIENNRAAGKLSAKYFSPWDLRKDD